MATWVRHWASRFPGVGRSGIFGAALVLIASAPAAVAQTTLEPRVGTGLAGEEAVEGEGMQSELSAEEGEQMLQGSQEQSERVSSEAQQSIDNAAETPIPRVD
jgi:hypothetical protein